MTDLTRWDVIVVGGANTDYVVRGKTLPQPGETIDGDTFLSAIGGKGVNQAVAAARMGAKVAFIGRVGNDSRGDQILEGLDREGVDTTFVSCTDHKPTGVALVMVDEHGKKQILTSPGANHDMRMSDIERTTAAIQSAKVFLTQLEIPLKIVHAVLKIAHYSNLTTILDPAPAQPLDPDLLGLVHVIRPNTNEAQVLTGIHRIHNRTAARKAARVLLDHGVRAAVIQAGDEGNLLISDGAEHWLPHLDVPAVDATGAGDAFAGALAAQLASGADLLTASTFANAASALATTRLGAQASLPTREEVQDLVNRSHAA